MAGQVREVLQAEKMEPGATGQQPTPVPYRISQLLAQGPAGRKLRNIP